MLPKTTIRIAAAALIATCAPAQTPEPLREFEVASIKLNKSNERMYYGLRNGSLTIRNMTVKGLIEVAYGMRDFQVSGGPAWINSESFDIDAKALRPLKATHEMEKSLLASRFHLVVHKETKEASVYSLVVARGGLKMKLSADQTDPEKGGPKEMGPGRLIGEGIPVYVIVNLLSNMLGRRVINNTGLAGKYDVNLQSASDSVESAAGQDDDLNLALIEAVERQLGLRLETIRAPDVVLVIEHIEHPSSN